MPAPLIAHPLALRALAAGGAMVAAAALRAALRRRRNSGEAPSLRPLASARAEAVEDGALDRLEDGGTAEARHRAEGAESRARLRWRRTLRFGLDGPGVSVDAAAIGRLRVRLVGPERRS